MNIEVRFVDGTHEECLNATVRKGTQTRVFTVRFDDGTRSYYPMEHVKAVQEIAPAITARKEE